MAKLNTSVLASILFTMIAFNSYALTFADEEQKRAEDPAEIDCPVCYAVLKKLDTQVKTSDDRSADAYAKEFLNLCSTPTKTEKSFCYYLGGDPNSATRTYAEMTKKLSQGLPIGRICKQLNHGDSQICNIREKQTIKLKDLDLNSMKASQLKRILNDKGDPCKGCVEKSEFIARLNKLKELEKENSAEL